MTINKLTASFGKLSGDSLVLHDGLNVICAPNESGKSTWCAFIRAMLYGIDSSERQKAGYLPDKTRYAPWSGAAMQGEMELSYGDKSISITRTTKLKSAPMREFSAVYTGTNVEVEGLDGSNAGELLTGATKEVFRRSAFIEQGAIAVSGSPELEKRISAIVSTGDENCSFTEADERLRAWQRARRYNRRGRLPELEERIESTKQRISELEAAAMESERLSAQLEQSRDKCSRLSEAVNESRKAARREALQNLQNLRREINTANEAHERADDERDAKRAALCSSIIGEREPSEVSSEVKADLEECFEQKAISEKKTSIVPSAVAFVLAIGLAIAAFLLIPAAYLYYSLAGAAALLLLGIILAVKHIRTQNEIREAKKRRRRLLAKYKAEQESDIEACEAEYLSLYEDFKAAEEKEKLTAEKLAEVRQRQELTEAKTLTELDFNNGNSEAAQLGQQYADAKRDCEILSERISELKGRINTMGDPLVLGSELKNMQSEYSELQKEFDALSLAVDTLRAADADIQSRFSPELGKLAAHYMSLVTDGRYESVLINRDFTAKTKTADDSVSHETGYLSAGTLDLMYLAVRLAVCKLALPESSECPLILDDTLVNLDDERTKQAMLLLEEIAKERQVILFTCKKI